MCPYPSNKPKLSANSGSLGVVDPNKMPFHAVDWSEFHVWCFLTEDIQKANTKYIKVHEKFWKTYDQKMDNMEVVCPTCVATRKAAITAYCQFASGAMGGGAATFATHWLDTIKVKMQSFPTLYRTTGSCFVDTYRHEGLHGLYQGAVPALFGHAGKAAIVFMSYGICEELVMKVTGRQNSDLKVRHHATAGAMTGVVASFFLCPLELIKCRMQALEQLTSHQRNHPVALQQASIVAIARDILRREGIRGLYRGLPGIWVKDVPGSFIFFGSYEFAKSMIKHTLHVDNLSSREVFLAGVFAGLCFCSTHPIESIKTRVQVLSGSSSHSHQVRHGFIGTAWHILRNEGFKPLCSGLTPSMIRAGLFSGIQFLVYEKARSVLLNKWVEDDPDD